MAREAKVLGEIALGSYRLRVNRKDLRPRAGFSTKRQDKTAKRNEIKKEIMTFSQTDISAPKN
jgi:hypothetical protein